MFQRPRGSPCSKAFTRLDLVVGLSMLALLLVVIRPAGGSVDPASRQVQCLANLRQLGVAWSLYAEDHRGGFAANDASVNLSRPSWALGWLTWDTSPQNTNTQYLVDPQYGLLAPYIAGDATLFKCPADVYLSSAQVARGWTERVRSYAMNGYVGPPAGNKTGLPTPNQVFTRWSDFRKLSPAQTLLVLEEHPDSINDAMFYPPASGVAQWIDLPASFHEGACTVSFVDGHVEVKRWLSARTIVPVRFNFLPLAVPPSDPDLMWMQARATERP